MTDDAMTTHMFGSAPPAPQEIAGEAVVCPDCKGRGRWSFSDGGNVCLKCQGMGTMKRSHPTPTAAPTDNTALVERLRKAGLFFSEISEPDHRDTIVDAMTALSTRPAEATSRDAVTEAEGLRALLARAESFISGFEGGASQNGVEELLREIRASAEIVRPLDEWHEDMGFVVWWKFPVEEPAWIGSPLCSDWPGYHMHFTPHPCVPAVAPTTREGE